MKWLGRDVWTELFGKQIDNLKTDRQGIYKLYDDTFRPNTRVHAEDRARVQSALQALGIPTAVHYPKALHHQAAYASHCCPECCPVSQSVAERVLSLPMSADLSLADQDRVVAALAGVLAR